MTRILAHAQYEMPFGLVRFGLMGFGLMGSRLSRVYFTIYGKLPFDILSPQTRMGGIFQGLSGVVCQMDDVLIFGMDKEEHYM